MNSINIVGRLTENAEVTATQSGIYVCKFTVAVRRPNSKDVTDFIPCIAWRNTAEFIGKYFSKGQIICVTGILTTRKYEDKNGNKRTAYEVNVQNAAFGGDKPGAGSGDAPETATAVDSYVEIENDEDLPF